MCVICQRGQQIVCLCENDMWCRAYLMIFCAYYARINRSREINEMAAMHVNNMCRYWNITHLTAVIVLTSSVDTIPFQSISVTINQYINMALIFYSCQVYYWHDVASIITRNNKDTMICAKWLNCLTVLYCDIIVRTSYYELLFILST